MLRNPFHGWTINQEIQKLTAFSTPSPYLSPIHESPASATRPTPLTSLSPLLPKSSTATYYSHAPEPEPNAHLEDSNLNAESTRESSNDLWEDGGDGEGFSHRRTLPEERVLLFTCISEDGECYVYVVRTKHNS